MPSFMLPKAVTNLKNTMYCPQSLPNKAVRIMNFKQQDFPVNELYNETLKIKDYILLFNFLFVRDVL